MGLYEIKKAGAFWLVATLSGVVQFRSLSRKNCLDWLADNMPKEPAPA